MDVHHTAVHISVRQHCISHIRHFLHSSKPVECDLPVDTVVALLGAGAVPRSFDEARCNSVDCDAFGSNSFTRDLVRKWMAAW